MHEWVKEFEVNEGYRVHKRRNSVKLTHEILSWHPKDRDKLTLEGIEAMTRQYITERNPYGLYVGAIHQSQDHFHVHLCVSGVEYRSGKAMRLSKAELTEVKQNTQAFQREHYPELIHSVVDHGRGTGLQLSDREYRYAGVPTRQRLAEQIQGLVDSVKNESELISALVQSNLEPYYRNERLQGVMVDGRKYRLRRLGVVMDYKHKEKGR